MQLFYCSSGFINNEAVLDAEESHHCIRVLRYKPGNIIEVVDGQGRYAEAEIISDDAKNCRLSILKLIEDFDHRPYHLHIAIAPTKNNDRSEWFVEKAVEFGVDEISFIACQRSERRNLNTERMTKIALSAMKQSGKASLPIIHPIAAFKQFLSVPADANRYIAHCTDTEKKSLSMVMPKHERSLVLIGPEGDFSPDEIAMALQSGFRAVSLGNSRLRTETAGVAACHIAALINEK